MSTSPVDAAGAGRSIYDAPLAPFTGGGQTNSFDDFLGQAQANGYPLIHDRDPPPNIGQPPTRQSGGGPSHDDQPPSEKTPAKIAARKSTADSTDPNHAPAGDDASTAAASDGTNAPVAHDHASKTAKPSGTKPSKADSKKPAGDKKTGDKKAGDKGDRSGDTGSQAGDIGQTSANAAAAASVPLAVATTTDTTSKSESAAKSDSTNQSSATTVDATAAHATKGGGKDAKPITANSAPSPKAAAKVVVAPAAEVSPADPAASTNQQKTADSTGTAPPTDAAPAQAPNAKPAAGEKSLSLPALSGQVAHNLSPSDASPGKAASPGKPAPARSASSAATPVKPQTAKAGQQKADKIAITVAPSAAISSNPPSAGSTAANSATTSAETQAIVAAPVAPVSDQAPATIAASAAPPAPAAAVSPTALPASTSNPAPTQPVPQPTGGSSFAAQLAKVAGGDAGPSTAAGAVDRVRFVQRVARAFQAAGDQGGVVRLRLSPPDLGSLQVQISVKQGELSAHIQAETSAAQQALLDNLPDLRDRLAQQDIRIERFDVDLMDQSSGGMPQTPQGNPDPNQYSRPAAPARVGRASASEVAAEPIRVQPVVTSGALNVVI